MATDYNSYIKGLIDEMYNPQVTAAQSAYDASAADLNTKISGAPTAYQPVRNNAYITQLQQQRLYDENMANMGYSGAGQMSQTLRQRASNNLQSTLGAIDTSQQEYINSLASELRNATVARDTALAGIEANRGGAMISAYTDEQNKAIQLYAAGIISAAQFEQMTGIKPVKRGKSGSPNPTGPPDGLTPAQKYQWYIDHGYSPEVAADLSQFTPKAAPDARTNAPLNKVAKVHNELY